MSFCPLGKSFGVMVQKSRWKVSFREDFETVSDVISEVLEQVQHLVELVNKIENF